MAEVIKDAEIIREMEAEFMALTSVKQMTMDFVDNFIAFVKKWRNYLTFSKENAGVCVYARYIDYGRYDFAKLRLGYGKTYSMNVLFHKYSISSYSEDKELYEKTKQFFDFCFDKAEEQEKVFIQSGLDDAVNFIKQKDAELQSAESFVKSEKQCSKSDLIDACKDLVSHNGGKLEFVHPEVNGDDIFYVRESGDSKNIFSVFSNNLTGGLDCNGFRIIQPIEKEKKELDQLYQLCSKEKILKKLPSVPFLIMQEQKSYRK